AGTAERQGGALRIQADQRHSGENRLPTAGRQRRAFCRLCTAQDLLARESSGRERRRIPLSLCRGELRLSGELAMCVLRAKADLASTRGVSASGPPPT